MTAHPAPEDSRVEKIAEAKRHELFAPKASCRPIAEGAIRTCEAGGMLVLDPSSDALVERIRQAIAPLYDGGPVADFTARAARAVLAALSTPAAPGGAE